MSDDNNKQKRGFALLSKEKVSELASKGGRRAWELGKAHKFNGAEASEAGRKGGLAAAANRKANG